MNFYKILKIKKLGRGSPDFWSRLFAKHTGGGSIKPVIVELTGKLPLTFIASDTKLHDWTIYGNNEPGERNTPQVYTEWEQGTRVPTAQGGETYTQIKANASNRVRTVNLIPVVTPFYYEINPGYQIDATFFDENGLSLGSGSNVAFRSAPYIYTGVGKYVSFAIKNNASTAITPSDDFEVKVASPYYQVGVGERTKNLISVEDVTGGITPQVTITRRDELTGSIEATTTSGLTYRNIWWYPEFEEGQTYILSCYVNEVNEHARLTFRRKSSNSVIASAWFTSTGMTNAQIKYTSEAYPGGVYVALMLNDRAATAGEINISELMLRKAGTSADFIPYGYQIPLDVRDGKTGEYNYAYDIFIGESPLTEGESISKSSTSIDIQTIADGGSYPNILTTSLSNKPEMTIKYKTKGGK